jgi:hypothetical protein
MNTVQERAVGPGGDDFGGEADESADWSKVALSGFVSLG